LQFIGYARVSTYGQSLETQLEQLRAAGCNSRNIYREKVTGARPDRGELNRMLGKLAAGDVVTVTRIDRLARSTFDLFGIVKRIVDAKAQFRSLAEPWADTGTSTGRLMLAVLGGLADVERDLIRTRTAEGRSRAKARGKHMGRPPSLTPEQRKEATRRRVQGATLQELADSYDSSISTMRRATPPLNCPPRSLPSYTPTMRSTLQIVTASTTANFSFGRRRADRCWSCLPPMTTTWNFSNPWGVPPLAAQEVSAESFASRITSLTRVWTVAWKQKVPILIQVKAGSSLRNA